MSRARKWAHDYVPVAFVVGACFVMPVGGAALGIATDIAASIAGRSADGALDWWKRRVTGGGLPLNHDIQRALTSAYRESIKHIESLWKKSGRRGANPETTAELFKWLYDDAAVILSTEHLDRYAADPDALKALAKEGVTSKGLLDYFLAPYLHGHEPQVVVLIRSALEPGLAAFFAEELKTNDRAWRAFQRLTADGLAEGIRAIAGQQGTLVENDRRILDELAAIREKLDAAPPEQRLPYGETGLDRAIKDSEARIIEAVTEHTGIVRELVEELLEEQRSARDELRIVRDEARAGREAERAFLEQVRAELLAEIKQLREQPARVVVQGRFFSVPIRQNRFFWGRDALLERIAAATRRPNRPPVLAQVLRAPGGFGKSQIAAEFAHRHRDNYAGVWWIEAETLAQAQTRMAELAVTLGLTPGGQGEPARAAETARAYLESGGGISRRWLLIFDNANGPVDVDAFVPRGGDADVLITSRSPTWPSPYEQVAVEPLSPNDARDFLLRRTGSLDRDAATRIAALHEGLPLALELVGAWVDAFPHQRTLAGYLIEFGHEHREPPPTQAVDIGEAPQAVTDTWAVTIAAVEEELPEAADLLRLLAWFAPDDIPLDLIKEHASLLPESLAKALTDPNEPAVVTLYRYSLIKLLDNGMISVHRLIQSATRERLDSESQGQWAGSALRIISAAFPDPEDVSLWSIAEQVYPHAVTITNETERLDVEPAATALLLNRSGRFAGSQGRLSPQRDHHERALTIYRRILPPDHHDIATSLYHLAQVLDSQGELDRARALYEEALAMCSRLFPADHPDIATSLTSLANVLADQGELDRARSLHEEALAMRRRLLPPDHHDIAISLNNLAGVLESQGELDRARALHEESLAMSRRLLPPDHPHIATGLSNLAGVLESQGELDRARALHEEALAMQRRLLPPDHPSTATSLNNLALVLNRQGELDLARSLHEEVLAMRRRLLSPDHPSIATSLLNLANVLYLQGELDRARALCEESLAMKRRLLPPDHPSIATSLSGLAYVLEDQGELDRARALHEEALAMRRRLLRADHPDIADSLNSLARIRTKMQPESGIKKLKRLFGGR